MSASRCALTSLTCKVKVRGTGSRRGRSVVRPAGLTCRCCSRAFAELVPSSQGLLQDSCHSSAATASFCKSTLEPQAGLYICFCPRIMLLPRNMHAFLQKKPESLLQFSFAFWIIFVTSSPNVFLCVVAMLQCLLRCRQFEAPTVACQACMVVSLQ